MSDREAWLEARKQVITGSDMGAIFGLKPWCTPLQVWAEKRGLVDPPADTPAMKWGRKLEPLVLEEFSEVMGRDHVRADPYHLFLSAAAPVGATLDGWLSTLDDEDGCPVEAKTSAFLDPDDWGPSMTDQVPNAYIMQVMTQLHVTGKPHGYLAAFFTARRDMRVYRIDRSAALEEVMLDRSSAWWRRHIKDGHQPEIDGSDFARSYILKQFPKNIEPLRQSDAVFDGMAESFRLLKKIKKETDTQLNELKNKITEWIGHSEGAEGSFGKVTWKKNKDGSDIEWDKIIAGLAERFCISDKAIEALMVEHKITKPGPRVLRCKWANVEGDEE